MIVMMVVAVLVLMVMIIIKSKIRAPTQVLMSIKPPFTELLCSRHTSRALHSSLLEILESETQTTHCKYLTCR